MQGRRQLRPRCRCARSYGPEEAADTQVLLQGLTSSVYEVNSLLPNGYSGESCKKQWYVVYAKSRQEAVAEENLGRQGYEVYLPLIAQPRRQRGQWRQVLEPLFPRYLFVHLRLGCDNIGPIRYTTGVSSLVRFREELGLTRSSSR